MLQQTQVATVIPYFLRFLARFPDLPALANASEDEVLTLWSGLGYYSRARNLHQAAKRVVSEFDGKFPEAISCIETLPGVGRSTAAAIAALAFGKTHAILDGNVRRVLSRHAGVTGWPGDKRIEARLWLIAESLLPQKHIQAYTQGMMDLGASVCTRSRPACTTCPVAEDCVAFTQGRLSQLPAPKPKKMLPGKQVQMLMLLDREKILLEKRPSNGIWGGLWCFPEIDLQTDVLEYCRNHLGYNVKTNYSLPCFKHVFTHFRLEITPQVIQVKPGGGGNSPSRQHWVTRAEAGNAAVPAPVRKLILQLGNESIHSTDLVT